MAFASAPESREIRYFRYEFCRSFVECNVVRWGGLSNDVAWAVDEVAGDWGGLLARAIVVLASYPLVSRVGVVRRTLSVRAW
jgi:hypothetical protein